MADKRMLNQRQMEMMSGLTGTPMAQAPNPGIPAEYNASMDAMSKALEERALKEQLMQQANQQAQAERFQGLRQKMQPPAPAPMVPQPEPRAIELSQDPEEMQRQIQAARMGQR